jgi:hypothetical protein
MTDLRFMGDWGVAVPLAIATAAAAAALGLYRREVRGGADGAGPWLAALRAAAVFLVALMAAGPVLHHRRVIGDLIQLRVVLDASQSMGRCDPQMESGRKLLIAHRLGWTDAAGLDAAPLRAADRLQAAREAAASPEAAVDPAAAARAFGDAVAEARRDLDAAQAATLGRMRQSGAADLERWENLPGSQIADLITKDAFRGTPQRREAVRALESPRNSGDNYGERIRGYLVAPASGDYTFWLTSDDDGELWLSSGEDPGLRSRIASISGAWAPPDQWEQTPSQKSRRIRLEAGRRYYFEALHKEGSGEDHLAVRWQLPDGKIESPIPGMRLLPFDGGGAGGGDPKAAFAADLAEPARALEAKAAAGAPGLHDETSRLARVAEVWERELRDAFLRHAADLAGQDQPAIRAVLERFDRTPRWQRIAGALWEGRAPALAALAEDHDVSLHVLKDGRIEEAWRSRAGRQGSAGDAPATVRAGPQGTFTDLSGAWFGLEAGGRGEPAADGAEGGIRSAVLLLSDGIHNLGETPLRAARVLGAKGVPVFPVLVGADRAPEDVAVVGVDAPASIFHSDRARGRVVVADHLPAGRPFTVRILRGDEVVWEQKLFGEGSGLRPIEYELPIDRLAKEETLRGVQGVQRAGVRLDLRAVVAEVEGDAEPGNNERGFEIFAVTRKYRVLLLEGRARWEWRYVRNLFERDEKWETASVFCPSGELPRGDKNDEFPASRDALFAFDLVVLGELPRAAFRPQELEWIRDFVGDRGGGLILLDGQRESLRSHADGELGPLFPADWVAGRAEILPSALRLTPSGEGIAALDLSADGLTRNAVWAMLRPPHRVEPLRPRPGADVWVEAVTRGGEAVPAILGRPFGAGRVLHVAFDESWRWRYEVADKHHTRFWNQLAMAMMESPFAVRDDRVSVDAGAPVQRPGERARLRARLRDERGRALTGATVFAHVHRDGRRIAVLPMLPDESGGGAYRTETGALEPGEHEIRLVVKGIPEDDIRAFATFVVKPRDTGELADLAANEPLMRQIASVTRGQFVREENMDVAVSALKPMSRGRVVESETVLWQSWPWFGLVVLLLTVEWIVRKRKGML